MSLIKFVNDIELAEPKFQLLGLSKDSGNPVDNKPEGYLVGGAAAAFTEKLSGQDKKDILNATLLAQLASDKKFNSRTQVIQWYDFYKLVLGKIGFVIENFSFEEHKTSGSSVSMDQVVIEMLEAIATGGQMGVLKATLAAMKASSKEGRLTLFERQASKDNAGNFQIYPCTKAENGDVSIAMGAFYFDSKDTQGGFLFFHWKKSDVHIFKGSQKMVLNVDVYSQVRSRISAKLGQNANDFVDLLDF